MEFVKSPYLTRLQHRELFRNIAGGVERVSGLTENGKRAHFRSICSKLHQVLGVRRIDDILRKDYDYATRVVLSYPGHGQDWPVKSA